MATEQNYSIYSHSIDPWFHKMNLIEARKLEWEWNRVFPEVIKNGYKVIGAISGASPLLTCHSAGLDRVEYQRKFAQELVNELMMDDKMTGRILRFYTWRTVSHYPRADWPERESLTFGEIITHPYGVTIFSRPIDIQARNRVIPRNF